MAKGCRWSVYADYSTGQNAGPRRGWQEVYCEPTKAKARREAKSWRGRTGMAVRVTKAAR